MYDELWVGVLIHEASVILVILNGARLAGSEGAQSNCCETSLCLLVEGHERTPSRMLSDVGWHVLRHLLPRGIFKP